MIHRNATKLCALLLSCSLMACYKAVPPQIPSVALQGYSDDNYGVLDENIGSETCARGRLNIDTAGVYFPLQPIESDGIISVGFSRINTDLTDSAISRHRLKSGNEYQVCGVLQDDTPFEDCRTNQCKWYRIEGATYRK